MEFMEDLTARTSHDRAQNIIRGKRTKRQRPNSPIAVAVTTSSASSGGGGDNRTGDGGCMIDYYTSDQSTTMSSEMSTEEEEDMANCLIMLAQSVSPVKEEISDHCRQKTEKLSSRRFTEMAAAAASGGKTGVYVYDCKTCNRSFQSFQALGGHRASHKKPKLNVEEKKSVSVDIQPPEEDQHKFVVEEEEEENKIKSNLKSSPPPSGFIQTTIGNNTKGKVHECSICRSEFSSGQALGGHMRRHRTTPPPTNQIGVTKNIDDRGADHHHLMENSSRASRMFSLDLNLPATEVVDDDVHSKFQFTASSSHHLVFSASALVDCHY